MVVADVMSIHIFSFNCVFLEYCHGREILWGIWFIFHFFFFTFEKGEREREKESLFLVIEKLFW